MGTYVDKNGVPHPERRKDPDLRAIYDDVLRLIKPFVEESGGWKGGPLAYWAMRAIQDACPELAHEQVNTLVSAALRVTVLPPSSEADPAPK